ncbi:ankyrin [Testicularia cyperi]|uniref:Ankyrin n=1 Tax=Testicularia cyperi TaxID=1882483 RepID=A0A317XR29_9BASI|nr:ankyrin [Testicularia cyperi]
MADSVDDSAVDQLDVQNKRLLHAARTDDIDLLQDIIASGAFDANHSDGLGNNALHYAAAHQSTQVLPEILNLEIDVDYQNRMEASTPLHEACKIEIPQGDAGREVEEIRNWIVNELLEAGADPRIANKDNDTPADLLSYGSKAKSKFGQELLARLKRGEAEVAVDASDVANDEDIDDGEGEYAWLRSSPDVTAG